MPFRRLLYWVGSVTSCSSPQHGNVPVRATRTLLKAVASDRRRKLRQTKIWLSTAVKFMFATLPSSNKDDQKRSIFQKSERGGLKLRDSVQFHLYISTSPCGDARIFSPHEPILEGTGLGQPRLREARVMG